MMKIELLILTCILFSFSTASTVATFHGQLEKQGAKASYTVGFASDEYSNLELSVPEKEGLNISYPENFEFEPEEVSRSISREGQNIPVKELNIEVSSVNPVKQSYEIPVTLRAHGGDRVEGRASPRVVHERKYFFTYLTEISPEYNFEGGLIDNNSSVKEKKESESSQQKETVSEENSLTEGNQNTKHEETSKKTDEEGANMVLVVGVLLVFSYVIYEAVT